MRKADEESGPASAGPRSLKTLQPIKLTREDKRLLRKLSKRKPVNMNAWIGRRPKFSLWRWIANLFQKGQG